MADLDLDVWVSRELLALDPLNINGGTRFKTSTTFLGSLVSWNRTQVGSPYMDGKVTVNRVLEQVQEPVAVEVWGRTLADATMTNAQLRINMNTLCQAFWQDAFTVTVDIDGATYTYQCEAADVQVAWDGNRFRAKRGLITFTVPRQPRSLVDGLL